MCQDTGTAIVKGKKGQFVFTGGGAPRSNDSRSEAEMARDDLAALHFDVTRLVLENKSLNTYENALFSATNPAECTLRIEGGGGTCDAHSDGFRQGSSAT